MEIYNENMERIEKHDLERGWLEESFRTVHHEAVEGVEEVWHYEIIAEYPNGGKDVKKVIDVQGIEAKEAWDERIPIRIYHPFTSEELEEREAQASQPTTQERVERLEAAVHALSGRFDEIIQMTAAYQAVKGV